MYYLSFKNSKEGEANKQLCNKQMMVINAAYKVLKDPLLRKEYDRKRKWVDTKANSNSDYKRSGTSNQAKRTSGGPENPFKQTTNNSNSSNNIYEPVESLTDILADLWKDVSKNKGSELFEDFVKFLEV